MVADHLLFDNTKGHGRKAHGLLFLWSIGVLEHWSIGTAKLRVLECGLQDFSFVFDFVLSVFNPKSETGNPPEGWESEGQIRNLKSEGGGEHGAGSCSKRSS
jgi:hypothetical protein